MKKTVCVAVMIFALLVPCVGSVLAYSPIEANINLLIGQKNVNDDADYGFEYYEVEEQTALGLMFDIKPAGFPLAIALDLLKSEESKDLYDPIYDLDYEATGETQEIDLGIRYYTPPHIIRGYFGGGLALIEGELTLEVPGIGELSDDDDEVGFWINGGFMCTLAQHLNLGVDLRYTQADVELLDETVDAGGVTISGFVGFHF